MTMRPRLRRVALTTHIVVSIGWVGALAGFLALAIAGLVSSDNRTVRASYIANDVIARFVIVPLAFASVLTGIIQALGTEWGLLRNYWVVFKLTIVVTATIMLLGKTGPIGYVARAAAETILSSADLRGERLSILGHAIGGLLVLLWAVALGMYKPRGLTHYGWRKRREEVPSPS
jgi:hypothetical protein